jgi:DNA-binding transcriptional LysR family regulator
VVLETDSLFHLVSAVRHRLGWAIVSAGLARSASKLSDLVCLPLAPLENIGHTAFLTRQQSITPAMRAFLEVVAEGEPANAP